ncbi:conserved membrane hypothetical protein [Burkholderia gladioli]|uniref:EamA-like transporter family protein n=1 Tax=Burkholderia gladioli (strain BSR3) TaxID=999541 RepID=F2LMD4_BURGS|nr:DMT family transporter [Burkholderia gladioli]AEA64218.1 hypothetical protein bgla_2g17800 [Burkholderia gladioli BSR3]MBW5286944.1 DMT family transporter [Burkholderia gladioli]CAG9228498.1 conserved membrane hypothetical protein [Burkholderia gladioli]
MSANTLFGQLRDWLVALAGGVLLALMIDSNSWLARYSNPVHASWIAHGIGAAVALLLILVVERARRKRSPSAASGAKAPAWFYLGGIPGALTVTLAAIAINGDLSLSGAIALMLLGQVLFGMLSDHFGLLRMPRRKIVAWDLVVVLCVLSGSALIIYGDKHA